MSNLYLVRHGQAGTRDAYDSLSELGRQQARLLGEYFISENLEFTAVYCGSMVRQMQTAEEVSKAFTEVGKPFPETVVEPRLCEFDLARVYRELAPLLCEEDPRFRVEFEEMLAEVKQSNGSHDAPVHRRWRSCDTKIVDAWIAGKLTYSGESWEEFRGRVISCIEILRHSPRHSNVLVFTSATPAAVLTSLALGVTYKRERQLAGVMYNSAYTVLRQRDEEFQLFQFNAVPHLAPELRTHR